MLSIGKKEVFCKISSTTMASGQKDNSRLHRETIRIKKTNFSRSGEKRDKTGFKIGSE